MDDTTMNADPILPKTELPNNYPEGGLAKSYEGLDDVENQGVSPTSNPGIFVEDEFLRLASINPLPSSSQPGNMSLPGAYGVQAYGAPDPYQPPPRPEVQPEASPESTGLGTDGLVVANLVANQETQSDLPAAVPADTIRERKHQTKPMKTYIIVAVAILCLAIVLCLLFFLITSRGQNARPALEDDLNPSQTYITTQSPTSLRGTVLSLLPLESTNSILDDSNSPQAMAFEWLVEDVHSGVSRALLDQDQHGRIVQRFALATFYFATNGPGWTANDNWLDHEVTECNWYKGASFSDRDKRSTFIPGYLTEFADISGAPNCYDSDDYGPESYYKHLWLDQNNLVGELPEELFLLTTLETVSLSRNTLEGTISTRVGQLTMLRGMVLNHIKNAHQIPSEIGLLTELVGLGLNHNQHEGFVPKQLWQGLTNLRSLFLGKNPDLKGSIPPEIGAMTDLRFISMERCQFFGTIPSQVGQLQHVELWSLYGNQLSGSIPKELTNVSSLEYLTLYNNHLSGVIPTQLGVMTALTLLGLSDNQLSGSMPSEFGRLTNMAMYLDLQNNPLLTGTVPTQLGLLTSLRELELHNNALTGPIPTEIGGLVLMGKLSFANNSLSGVVPQELADLRPTLHTLRLEGNPQLSGKLPDPICNLNATCTEYGWLRCQEPSGVKFDCTHNMCGCGCSC